MAHADPWRFAFTLPLVGRALCLTAVLSPEIGRRFADLVFVGAEAADSIGLEGPAMRAAGLVFGIEYFRGIRVEAGSLSEVAAGCLRFLRKASRSETRVPGVPAWLARMAQQRLRPAHD
jgi:hypothetical protein